MFETILAFLRCTGIKEDTFGRLTLNDPRLMSKLERGMTLSEESTNIVMLFMQNYEGRDDRDN